MSHVPTVLKSDRSVFDKMLPVDDNGNKRKYHQFDVYIYQCDENTRQKHERGIRVMSLKQVTYMCHRPVEASFFS